MTHFDEITADLDSLAVFLADHAGCPPCESTEELCRQRPKGDFTCDECWANWLDRGT